MKCRMHDAQLKKTRPGRVVDVIMFKDRFHWGKAGVGYFLKHSEEQPFICWVGRTICSAELYVCTSRLLIM